MSGAVTSRGVLKSPFPWFGGKSRAADLIWERFGSPPNYVEPFAGSLAVLLARVGGPGKNETVNDRDCYLSNFWRALTSDPEGVAHFADWPVNEADLHARHKWLVAQTDFRERMLSDPQFYDARIAGWWVWGVSQWIGSGWCTNPEWTGRSGVGMSSPRGIHAERWNKRPNLRRGGVGVLRRKLDSGDVWHQKPHIGGDSGASGMGIHAKFAADLYGYFNRLADRLSKVRVCCGDWARILGPSPTWRIGVTGVLLDPPYDLRSVRSQESGSDGAAPTDGLYAHHDNTLSASVREWAIANGANPLLRIALCGYDGEHEMPGDWQCVSWTSQGGYGNRTNGPNKRNKFRERVWFSPHCRRNSLFEAYA